MKNFKFTETQITRCLKEYESGKNIVDICRELKICVNLFKSASPAYFLH